VLAGTTFADAMLKLPAGLVNVAFGDRNQDA